MTALIVLGIIAVYMALGVFLGRRAVPGFLARQREQHPILYQGNDSYWSRSLKNEAAGLLLLWTLFWPVLGVARGILLLLGREVARVDPQEQQRIAKEKDAEAQAMQQRIRELERELGIRQ